MPEFPSVPRQDQSTVMTPPAPKRIAPLAALFVLLTAVPATAWADAFDNHTAYWLRQGTKDATALDVMTMRDALRLKPISKRMSSPCIVVRTDEDNWAKAIVTWGFRKGKENTSRLS